MRGRSADALAIFGMHARSAARDRHTLVYTVLIPLLLYPTLFLGMGQWLAYRRGVEERETYRVLLLPGALPPPLDDLLSGAKGLEIEREETGGFEPERALGERAEIVLAPGSSAGLRLFFDSGSERSQSARARVERALEEAREGARRQAASGRGLDPAELEILSVRREDTASPEEKGRRILGVMLPLLLVVMSVSGAFYLAIDLSAGEKERRTAETTLLLPVPVRSVFLGKFLAVLAAGGVACLLNLASMLLASRAFLSALEKGALAVRLPLASGALVMLVSLLFLACAASLLLALALFARSFREGQSLTTPLFLLLVLPPILALQPGTRLTYGAALLPFVNATFALREALEGTISTGPFLAALAALAAYGALAFALASRLHARATLHLADEAVPLKRLRELLGRGARA